MRILAAIQLNVCLTFRIWLQSGTKDYFGSPYVFIMRSSWNIYASLALLELIRIDRSTSGGARIQHSEARLLAKFILFPAAKNYFLEEQRR